MQQFETNETLICFTDGSTLRNGQKDAVGGFAVIWPYHNEYNYCNRLEEGTLHTNNRSEFSAVISAFQQADKIDPDGIKTLIIYTDSKLLINSMTEWLPRWKKNNYMKYDGRNPVMNQDLIKMIDDYTIRRKVIYIHVKAHTKGLEWASIQNDEVDKLAKSMTCPLV